MIPFSLFPLARTRTPWVLYTPSPDLADGRISEPSRGQIQVSVTGAFLSSEPYNL